MHIHSFYNLTYDYSSLCILILVIVAMKSMTQFSFNFGEQRFCDFAPSYKSDSSSVKIFYFLISRLTSSLFLFPTNTVGSNELNYPTLAFFFFVYLENENRFDLTKGQSLSMIEFPLLGASLKCDSST